MGAGKVETPQNLGALADIARKQIGMAQPSQRLMFKQLNEALKTGGVGARIPIIQRAVESSKTATQQGLQGAREQLGRSGLTGTPFASQILSGIQQQGSNEAARIPTDFAQQIIAGGPGMAQSTVSGGMGTLGQVGGAQLQAKMFNAKQFADAMNAIRSSLAGWYGGGG